MNLIMRGKQLTKMKIVLTNTIVKKYQEVAKTNEFHLNFSSQYVQAEHMDYVTSNVPLALILTFFFFHYR